MKKYIAAVISIPVAAILFVLLASRAAICITDSLNAKYMPLYRDGATGVSSPWYDAGYHIVDGRFIEEMSRMEEDEKKVISIGSSVCVVPFHSEIANEKSDFAYRFMTCGNGCWKSDQILYGLLKEADLIGEGDLIKLEISFSTFRDPGTTITESMLDKWGKYSVHYADPDDRYADPVIERNSALLTPVHALNAQLIRVQSVWDLTLDWADQVFHGSHGSGLTERAAEFGIRADGSYDQNNIPGNFRNNYYNPEAVADTLTISGVIEEKTEALISEINAENNLVVELSPIPDNLLQTPFGQEYKDYIDNRLIPYLDDNGIGYVDYRYDYAMEEYADGVHLGYDAGIRYTEKILEDMNGYQRKTAGRF